MEDPVSTSDGHSYERSNIEAWFVLGHRTSPLSNQVLRDLSLKPNHALRSAIREWDEARTLAERYRSPLGGAQYSRRAVLMVSPLLRGFRRALATNDGRGVLGWCRRHGLVPTAAALLVVARLLMATSAELQVTAAWQAADDAAVALEACELDRQLQDIGLDRCWIW